MKKRIFGSLIAACVAVCLMAAPCTAFAATANVDDLLANAVPYTGGTVLKGIYSVSGTVTVSERITVDSNATLVLVGDCVLNAEAGIELVGKNTLNIYAKKGDDGAVGTLKATAADDCDAGIGTGYCEAEPLNGGKMYVYGGVVIATGKAGGAGIGGGAGADGIAGGNGCALVVKDGTVTGIGGEYGIGIGGGRGGNGEAGGVGGKLQVSDGIVTGIGGEHGFAVGGGVAGDGYTGEDGRGEEPATSFGTSAVLQSGSSVETLEEVEEPDFVAAVFRVVGGSYLENMGIGSVLSDGSLVILLVIVVAAVAVVAALVIFKKRRNTAA